MAQNITQKWAESHGDPSKGTKQSLIEALTRVPAPEPKAPTLLAMKPGEFYSIIQLKRRVAEFTGIDEHALPIRGSSMFAYCRSNGAHQGGKLEDLGMVCEGRTLVWWRKRQIEASAYSKTEFGEKFGDPAAALGIWFTNRLVEMGKPAPRSLHRIIGGMNLKGSMRHGRGYSVFRIVEHLVKNPFAEYGAVDLAVVAGSPDSSATLHALGRSGMIDYVALNDEHGGKRAKGLARYAANSKLDYDECRASMTSLNPNLHYSRTKLKKVLDYFNANLGKETNCYDIEESTGIPHKEVSTLISHLECGGHLSAQFKGSTKMSSAKANAMTMLFWSEFLLPLGMAAEGDFKAPRFTEKLTYYREHPSVLREHIETTFEVYVAERTKGLPTAGEDMREALTGELASENGSSLKLSDLTERINYLREQEGLLSVSGSAVRRNLMVLCRSGAVEQTSRGMFAIRT